MVYFVCESCNETLKKAQVDRHLFSCKNCWGVTCVDCNFTFEGDSFRAHTSCVSEDQKYQGALFKAPKAKQKNRGVNEIWTDAVQLAASNASKGVAPKALSAHLVRMGDLGNVPRQEKKFKNFVKNSMRVFDDAGVAKLWEYLEGVKDAVTQQEKKEAEAAATSESRPAAEEKPAGKSAEKSGEKSAGKTKKGKKRAREESKADTAAEETPCSGNGTDSSKKRPRELQVDADVTPVMEGCPDEESRLAVDAVTRKSLAKAAIGIMKKAPNKELSVKELVKQAAAAARSKGGPAAEVDDKRLRRALRQRLKTEGIRRVSIADNVATYRKDAVVSA